MTFFFFFSHFCFLCFACCIFHVFLLCRGYAPSPPPFLLAADHLSGVVWRAVWQLFQPRSRMHPQFFGRRVQERQSFRAFVFPVPLVGTGRGGRLRLKLFVFSAVAPGGENEKVCIRVSAVKRERVHRGCAKRCHGVRFVQRGEHQDNTAKPTQVGLRTTSLSSGGLALSGWADKCLLF